MEITVTNVHPNVPVAAMTVPDTVRQATIQPVRVGRAQARNRAVAVCHDRSGPRGRDPESRVVRMYVLTRAARTVCDGSRYATDTEKVPQLTGPDRD